MALPLARIVGVSWWRRLLAWAGQRRMVRRCSHCERVIREDMNALRAESGCGRGDGDMCFTLVWT